MNNNNYQGNYQNNSQNSNPPTRERIFCGSGKLVQFSNGSTVIKLAISPENLDSILDNVNAEGWVKIDIFERNSISPKGMTHYAVINDYVPPQNQGQQPSYQNQPQGYQAQGQTNRPSYPNNPIPRQQVGTQRNYQAPAQGRYQEPQGQPWIAAPAGQYEEYLPEDDIPF